MNTRIMLYSGKGGVGKTTVAAASGLRCADLGYRTLVLSLDIAHSLADAFDLDIPLYETNKGRPVQLGDTLWIQEIDVQEEVERYWGDVYTYLAALLNTTGLDEIVASELAIIPGMEDVISLLYINQYVSEHAYDVLILDCAPTGESLRFITMPSTLEWYMEKLFTLERSIARVARPIARVMTDVPLPDDRYFQALEHLFTRLEGADRVLLDRKTTSVRLVTNAEKMVLRETQRAFMYFCLFGMAVDHIVVNRLIPPEEGGAYFKKWVATQRKYLDHLEDYFAPVPLARLPLFDDEVVGTDRLRHLADILYGPGDPSRVFYEGSPYEFVKKGRTYELSLKLPFVTKDQVELFQEGNELIVRIGSFKRHMLLPRTISRHRAEEARFDGEFLRIMFSGGDTHDPSA
jgi:arsenite-transporting ATPase